MVDKEPRERSIKFPIVPKKSIQKTIEQDLNPQNFGELWSDIEERSYDLAQYIHNSGVSRYFGAWFDEENIKKEVNVELQGEEVIDRDSEGENEEYNKYFSSGVRLHERGAAYMHKILINLEADEGIFLPRVKLETIEKHFQDQGSLVFNIGGLGENLSVSSGEFLGEETEHYREENPHLMEWVDSLGRIQKGGAMTMYLLMRKQFYDEKIDRLLK